MHVVRLLAPRIENEDQAKDGDFSPQGIRKRWEAGPMDTRRAIAQAPWRGELDALQGVVLHEPAPASRVEPAEAAPTGQTLPGGAAPRRVAESGLASIAAT